MIEYCVFIPFHCMFSFLFLSWHIECNMRFTLKFYHIFRFLSSVFVQYDENRDAYLSKKPKFINIIRAVCE